MDPSGGAAARLRRRRTASSSGRFLSVSPESAVPVGVGDEFSEDDVFWTGDFAEKSHLPSSSSTSSANVNHHHYRHHHGRGIGREENFGILAALPVTELDHSRSVFNHKASVSSSASSSASSSSRMIPLFPKKPPLVDRPDSLKHHQSAPVNVPVMTEAMRRNRAIRQFDDIDDDEDEGGEMLPPHEVVASRQSPMVACSVLEGVGRTLKGRDLRQVRNAVFRQTGFLD